MANQAASSLETEATKPDLAALPLLDGISLLEVGEGLPLAYAGKVLAAAGASVVKVEGPHGDPLRRWACSPGQDFGPLFEYLNASKRSVVLNLDDAAGRQQLVRLARSCSAVIHALRPGAARAAGLTYAALSAVNPALVVTAITPFGGSGPYQDFPATELTTFAVTSRLKAHGSPHREPISYAPEVLEFQVGATAALGTLAAIVGAELTGLGQEVDLSAAEALTGNVDQVLSVFSYTNEKTPRRGGEVLAAYPTGIYAVADGYVLIAGATFPFFDRLCRAIGRPELALDERWSMLQNRPAYRDDFMAILLPWLAERGQEEVIRSMQAAGVLSAPVLTLDRVLTDPQLAARGSLLHYDHSPYADLVYPGRPYLLSEAAPEPAVRAPHLGEHNAELLGREVGE